MIKPGDATFTYREVRLIGPDGEQVGIVSYADARQRAADAKLDLVLVADKSLPPVCRIMDYGKLVFEQKKNLKAQKKNNVTQKVKEIQFHVNIDDHDYQVKLNRGIDFLGKGNKLKVALSFRGREMQHQEIGFDLINRVTEDLKNVGSLEDPPKLVGKSIIVFFTPGKASSKAGEKAAAAAAPKAVDDTPVAAEPEATEEQ